MRKERAFPLVGDSASLTHGLGQALIGASMAAALQLARLTAECGLRITRPQVGASAAKRAHDHWQLMFRPMDRAKGTQ